jgi:hypothetical protein
MVATSASDRRRFGGGFGCARIGGIGPMGDRGHLRARAWPRGGIKNPWKERDAAPRKREPTSRTRRWSKASRSTGANRVETCGTCAAGGLMSSGPVRSLGDRQPSTSSTPCRQEERQPPPDADAAPGGNGRQAASAGGPSEPPPTLLPSLATVKKGRTKRRGGNDRSDAERLPTRIKPSKGQRCEDPGRPPLLRERSRPAARREHFGARRLAVEKRSEPHVRYRDATSPDPAVRSKPSRWCKTTRAEQDRRGVAATARRLVPRYCELVS